MSAGQLAGIGFFVRFAAWIYGLYPWMRLLSRMKPWKGHGVLLVAGLGLVS